MIWTIRVALPSDEDEWFADIELDTSTTLQQLLFAIQRAVEFGNDHLYAFFIANNERSRVRDEFDDENERLYTTQIGDLFPLPAKKKCFYLFDYGDNWIFRISKTRKAAQEPEDGVVYPRVVAEGGIEPDQYAPWEE